MGMGVDVERQTLGGISRKCLFLLDVFSLSLLPSFPNEGFVAFVALRGACRHRNLVREQRLAELVADLPRYTLENKLG